MITIRAHDQRDGTKFDWLDSSHTFSFGDDRDPDHRGFRTLRVKSDETRLTIAGAEPPESRAIGRHAEAATYPYADVLVFDLA